MVTPLEEEKPKKEIVPHVNAGEENTYLLTKVYKDDILIANLELRTSTLKLTVASGKKSTEWIKIEKTLKSKTYYNLEDVQTDILKGNKNYTFSPKGLVDEN